MSKQSFHLHAATCTMLWTAQPTELIGIMVQGQSSQWR